MRLLNSIIFFLSFITTSLFSQIDTCQTTIQGRVYDQSTKLPLLYATVQIKNQSTGAYTDEKGNFELNAPCQKEYDLQVSYVGYKTIVHHHDFHHPFVEIYLAPEGTMSLGRPVFFLIFRRLNT
jgi:hypothetical protein